MNITITLRRLIIAAIFVISNISGYAYAQNKVVVVPLFDSSSTGVAAIPVYCDDTILNISSASTDNIVCRRADTRAVITPVPNGHFLFISDFVVNRNNLQEGGRANIRVGIDSGGSFPTSPHFTFNVVLDQLVHLKFATPRLVLREGEQLGARNVHLSSAGGVTVNILASGYLVKATKFGR